MKNLVLIPGWSASSEVWRPIKRNLEKHFNVFYCDWYQVNSIEAYKQRVYDLIDRYVSGTFSVLGWSLGSLLAIETACCYKQSVKYLITVGGTSKFITDKKNGYDCGWAKRVVQRMKTALRLDKEVVMNDFYQAMFTELEKKKGYADRFIKDMAKIAEHDLVELEAGLDFLIEEDYREKLREITAKVILIHGEYDSICPIEASKYMTKHLKWHFEFVRVKNAGHIPFLTQREIFEKILFKVLV